MGGGRRNTGCHGQAQLMYFPPARGDPERAQAGLAQEFKRRMEASASGTDRTVGDTTRGSGSDGVGQADASLETLAPLAPLGNGCKAHMNKHAGCAPQAEEAADSAPTAIPRQQDAHARKDLSRVRLLAVTHPLTRPLRVASARAVSLCVSFFFFL